MNVRGVEIEVIRADVREAQADMTVSASAAGAKTDERSVRATCARVLADAQERGVASVALPALGVGPGGISLTASGKILVQEAIRVARVGFSSLRRILFCFPEGEGFEAFAGAVNGYVKHFLEVLIWGPFVTVDAIIEIPRGIVLVRRSNPPLGYAFPGGFVDYGESLETAVRREAMEETGLALDDLEQFHTYSDPSRDPRFHTVTTVFTANAAGTPRAGDDAADIRVVTPREIDGLEFAFDHRRVLGDYLESRRR